MRRIVWPLAAVVALSAPSAAPAREAAGARKHHRRCEGLRGRWHWGCRTRWHPSAPVLPWETEASWYYDEGSTACGTHFELGVANKTLPCGTRLEICAGRCVVATVDDRGPYVAGRELDLNVATRDALGCFTCDVRWGIAR